MGKILLEQNGNTGASSGSGIGPAWMSLPATCVWWRVREFSSGGSVPGLIPDLLITPMLVKNGYPDGACCRAGWSRLVYHRVLRCDRRISEWQDRALHQGDPEP